MELAYPQSIFQQVFNDLITLNLYANTKGLPHNGHFYLYDQIALWLFEFRNKYILRLNSFSFLCL